MEMRAPVFQIRKPPASACGPAAGPGPRRPARVAGAAAAAMSRRKVQQLVESLGRSAKHFNKSEVECLIKLFNALVKRPGQSNSRFAGLGFDRSMFRDTLHSAFGMTDVMLMDRVFRTFDRDNDSCIGVVEWVEGLSVFLRGTLEERIKYCFEVYDLNGDGYISREEMFQMLKNSLLKQPSEEDPDEGIKDLVDIALKKMDYDHDGKLSFMDFEKAVRDETLLLEAFGPCLPDLKSSMAFEEKTFRGNS
ncbi:ef-hand calcium-binding domain-containing protein 1 [Limosa lapponica baueri]|uniref:Ef-hand calcium-binding domain-containing protein 1 n=1 Tax=Limosa lapponica baueri TaxID=1758121 RepID=A0A2I0U4I3_LIMLA|nr:ef-hand calcium-binding domain-containing protein 1 [Limosa lapponica baueri]